MEDNISNALVDFCFQTLTAVKIIQLLPIGQVSNMSSTQELPPSTHKYLYSYDVNGAAAPARVARVVGCSKDALEVRSGPGTLTDVLNEVSGNRVTALEIDPTAIDIVQRHCIDVIQADLNYNTWHEAFNGKKIDATIAAHVLEHVIRPEQVLKGMTRLLND